MKQQAGFSLLELLVVLVIIGLLVSMATINTNYDKRKDLLTEEAKRLSFFLSASADEAMFQNKNIGYLVSKYQLTPYAWLQKEGASEDSLSDTATTPEYSWQSFTGRFIKPFELPEDMEFELTIQDSPVQLPFSAEVPEDELKPQFLMLSNGEQSQLNLSLLMDEYEGEAQVESSGLGRFHAKWLGINE